MLVCRRFFLLIILFLTVSLSLYAQVNKQSVQKWNTKQPSRLTENKGQVTDQNGKLRNDVKYIYSAPGFKAIFKANSFSYEVFTVEKKPKEQQISEATRKGLDEIFLPDKFKKPEDVTVKTSRIDIELPGANKNPQIIAEGKSDDYNNYYLAHTPEEGVQKVYSFSKLIYKNVWPNIDLMFYARKEGELKYDIVVNPGGNLKDITFTYDGVENINLENGKLTFHTATGNLQESIPLSYTLQDNEKVGIKYLLDGNRIFLNGNYDSTKTLIIDPVLDWGTYYGDDGTCGNAIICDVIGNVLITGYTESINNIATVGAFDTIFSGGSSAYLNRDVFIVKLNKNGVRQWGTYYGGSDDDQSFGICNDAKSSIYITGSTSSKDAISTQGANDTSNGGFSDGFLAKFDSSGVRKWSTYFGGSSGDCGYGISCGLNENIYIVGTTGSADSISTYGVHQSIKNLYDDAFLTKFDSSGSKKWSTYYGGEGYDWGQAVSCDEFDNIYITGYTYSTSDIATLGCHQDSLNGSCDAFLAKFNHLGKRSWGSYYGGEASNIGSGIKCDKAGFIYLTGFTTDTSSIASIGAHQETHGNPLSDDAYIVKFDSSGIREWGTYCGGSKEDYPYGISCDTFGNVYITGSTESENNIATSGAYQSINYNDFDAFVIKFSSSGKRLWGTYYGGYDSETGFAITSDLAGNIYITGTTQSFDSIATTNSHQTSKKSSLSIFGGNGFIVKLDIVDISLDKFLGLPLQICYNDSFLFSAQLSNHNKTPYSNVSVTVIFTGPDTLILSDSTKLDASTTANLKFNKWLKFEKPGVYSVVCFLDSADDNAFNDTLTTTFTVYKYAIPNFNLFTNCEDSTVQFVNESKSCNGGMTYNWEFGDGDTSTLKNPFKRYNSYGEFNVKLFVSTPNGKDSLTKKVIFYPKPKADFSFISTCLDSSIVFLNNSIVAADSITKYFWKFGDGDTSNSKNPQHQYIAAGDYKVTLKVELINGCLDSVSNIIAVYPKPLASFTVNDDCQSSLIYFQNTSTIDSGSSVKYLWNFGNGLIDTVENPKLIYDTAGRYIITLLAISDHGCTSIATDTLTIYSNAIPNFTFQNSCLDSSILFTNKSDTIINIPVNYIWNFGDGDTSTLRNPKHRYAAPGDYKVVLKSITDKGCTDSIAQTVTIYPKPKPSYITSNTCLHETSYFKNTTSIDTGNIISYSWDFGDGDTSQLENPTHIYDSIGQYKVVLKATSSFGCIDTFSQLITIFPKPKAFFTTTDICLSETAYFTDSSTMAADYFWNFGDSSISHLQNPIHKYYSAGTYMAKLVVKNTLGCTDTFAKEIVVSDMPKAIFLVHNICYTENVELADSSKGATERVWKFGDDSNTDEQNPTHYYGSAGTYNIWLIVSNKAGCKDSVMHSITVDSSCVWPGDANADKVVDNKDILAIGVAYNDTGSTRTDTSTLWKANLVKDWSNNFTSGANYKHADCDGDGTVSNMDTLAITRNYTKTHLKKFKTNRGKKTDPLLKVGIQNDSLKAGDTLTAYILLGENALPAKDVYGVAFSLDYNQDLFENKPIVDFKDCWLGNNIITYYNNTNQLDIALTKTDHKNISGAGKLAEIKLVVKKNFNSAENVKIEIVNNTLISADENKIPVNIVDDSVIVNKAPDNLINKAQILQSDIKIYPNPFRNETHIEYNLLKASKVSIVLNDMNGKTYPLLRNAKQLSGKHTYVLNAEENNLKAGVYALRIEVNGEAVYTKIVKVK